MNNQAWGGRFKKSLDPLVVAFNSSLSFDHVLYDVDIAGSKVHATMLAKQHLLSEQEAIDINKALDEIRDELKQGLHTLDAAYEDIHMFIEHLLIQKIGELGKKLHTGRSRNDQIALDLRLYMREIFLQIECLLDALIATLNSLSQQYCDDMMPGYTHLQQAQPIQLGTYFGAYQAMFERDKGRLQDCRTRMNYSPLGAGALAGSSLPLDRQYVADKLGFAGMIPNTLDAVSDRDYLIEFCSFASIVMMHLSRLSEDLIIWATQEFNYITLEDAFATGSSLMPHKKNPDIPELIRGKSGRVFGHLIGILTLMKGLPLTYNKDMQEDKEGLFDTIHTLMACLRIISPFLESLIFNTKLMQQKVCTGFLDATQKMEMLVLQGMPFRDAHHQVGKWVTSAIKNSCSLDEIIAKLFPPK